MCRRARLKRHFGNWHWRPREIFSTHFKRVAQVRECIFAAHVAIERGGDLSGFTVVLNRELRSLVATPLVWGAAAAVAIPAGMGFAFGGLVAGSVADLSRAIGISLWCVGAAACVLGARSVPSERRAGTWDLTLASPIHIATVLHAKFAAITVAGAALLLPICLQAIVLSTVATPSWSVITCGALGLWLIIVAASGVGLLAGVVVRSNAGAIVASLTAIAAWIALCRGGQSLQWPAIASAAFALDPLRRGEDFTRGTVDLGSAVALLAMGVGSAWCAGAWAINDAQMPTKRRELQRFAMCAGVFVAVVSTVIAVRGASAPTVSVQASSMFSGSLQPATKKFISQSAAPMNITLLSAKGNADLASLRNARAVLARASRGVLADGTFLNCQEFDSLELVDAEKSAAMFEMIEASESKNVNAWRQANDKGLEVFRSIESFADASEAQIQTLSNALAKDDPARVKLESFAAAMNKTALQGQSVREAISQMATPTPERPLGNAEGAGRTLANELKWWSNTLQQVADIVANRLQTFTPAMATIARQTQRNCARHAEQAKAAQDQIDQLPPLRLSEVAAAMQYPPTLIVSGTKGVAAIPAWQMRTSVDATELALAEAIRCAEGAPRIAATIVHAQSASPLESVSGGGDLSHIVQSLRAARIEVDEWNPSKGARPFTQGVKRVWIVVPPLDRSAQEPDADESALLAATRQLASEGENIFITATANPFAAMGMSDPWADLFQYAGLRAKSGQVVLDLGARSENVKELRSFIEFSGSDLGHGAGMSSANENILWPMPIPIEITKRESWTATAVELIQPAPQRWIESDPRVVSRSMDAAPEGKVFTQAIPVLVVAQRDDGIRLAISGGLSWLLTLHSGMSDGDSRTLRFPGNRDLAIGVIRWLAGSEAISTAADTGRVPELGQQSRVILSAFSLVVIPLSMALTGSLIWKSRKRR